MQVSEIIQHRYSRYHPIRQILVRTNSDVSRVDIATVLHAQ